MTIPKKYYQEIIQDVRFEQDEWHYVSVIAIFKDNAKYKIFGYYPDELYFSRNDIVGKTIDEALAIRLKKDVAYLRS